jgi:hypothetical protein
LALRFWLRPAASKAEGRAGEVCPVAKSRMFAMEVPHSPSRMFTNPLRNIGLRRHCTLSRRALPGELEALFLAQAGLPQSANHHDDLDHAMPRAKEGNFALCHNRHRAAWKPA